jgi:sugar lactone lactonase YvrE
MLRSIPLATVLVLAAAGLNGLRAEEPAAPAAPPGTPIELTTVDLSPLYPWEPGKDFDKRFPPELAPNEDLVWDPAKQDKPTIQPAADQVKWKKEVELNEGVLDLAGEFNGATKVVVYARAVLEAAETTKIHLGMGSDDGLSVFVNGKRVHAKNAMRGLKPNEDQVDAELAKGRNVLLFRVTQGDGGFGLQVAASNLGAGKVTQVHEKQPAKASFAFNLDAEALTSAGVYDAQGRLVRTLWRMKKFPAGKQERGWDGLDEFGQPAAPGEYQYRVVVNEAVYRNVGAIGNSGLPADSKHHTPTAMHDVAVDAEGAVYTVNYWDEAGADFTKWDKDGNSIYDAQYQMRNGTPNGAPYACATDEKYLYCTMEGWPGEQWKHSQQVQRFRLSDGKAEKLTEVGRPDGHIQIYEYPEKLIPKDAPKEEAELMNWPLRAIAVLGDSLLVADTIGGRVLRFHKVTGKPEGEFKVKLPTALAVDKTGKIWVGHDRTRVSVFSVDGKPEKEALTDLGRVKGLAFGPDGRLYVADAGTGQVRIYDVAGEKPKAIGTFGQKAVPGDRAADRFFDLRGVAVDRQGFLVTIQNEPLGGARVARFAPDGKLQWEHFGTVFVSLGNYGKDDPDTFYSMHFHRYRLKDRAQGQWEYTGNMYADGLAYRSDVHGVPRILKLGGNDFIFYPEGDGVQVYRITPKGFLLAALLGGTSPQPLEGITEKKVGKWAWTRTDGLPKAEEIRWFKKPGEKDAQYAVFGMDVDAQGAIWFGELHTKAIWTVPMKELNSAGNPVYDWAAAKPAIPRDATALKLEPNMVQHADDGSVYAFGWSAAWPSPKNNPFWMGGTTLVRFDKDGKRLWAVRLPEVCVGLDAIPGGGCMVGSGAGAVVYHFNADGLLIGAMKPGEAMCKESGWMDNHASVAVNRDPRDGILDIFAEDDYVLRLGWYRVDDRKIRALTGAIKLP